MRRLPRTDLMGRCRRNAVRRFVVQCDSDDWAIVSVMYCRRPSTPGEDEAVRAVADLPRLRRAGLLRTSTCGPEFASVVSARSSSAGCGPISIGRRMAFDSGLQRRGRPAIRTRAAVVPISAYGNISCRWRPAAASKR